MVCTSTNVLFQIKSISERNNSSANNGMSNRLELNPAKSESLKVHKREAQVP